jgi:predicted DsbA family dithiol-disulfide isomerase
MPVVSENRTDVSTTPRLLVFFDYSCQFCYLDWPRFKRLRAEHGAQIQLVPFELRPALDSAGVSAEEVGHKYSERVVEHMREMAEESGLRVEFPTFVPNTHMALSLGEYARDAGEAVHESVHEAIFEAYNASVRDIGDAEVLIDIARRFGLDDDDVGHALREGRYDDRLHRYACLTASMGITGTPAALICNELFIGTRPYRVLEESLERCLVTEDKILVGAQVGRKAAGAKEGAESLTEEAEMRRDGR